MTLTELMTRYRPEPSDGRGDTWDEHTAYLCRDDLAYLLGVLAHMLNVGWYGPNVIVDDGYVQDGHHRIVAAYALGMNDIDIPVTDK